MTRLNEIERELVKANIVAAKQALTDATGQDSNPAAPSAHDRELRERVNTLEDQLSLVKGRT